MNTKYRLNSQINPPAALLITMIIKLPSEKKKKSCRRKFLIKVYVKNNAKCSSAPNKLPFNLDFNEQKDLKIYFLGFWGRCFLIR